MDKLRQTPAGLKDYLFEEAQQRRELERQLTGVFREYGFREIITPSFEFHDVFEAAGRNGMDDKVYRFVDREGNLCALRSDFTAQMARIAATRLGEEDGPVRVFYSGKVYRHEDVHAGKSREVWQVGFEIFGGSGIDRDLESLEIIISAMKKLGLGQFRIGLSHAGFFAGIVEKAGLEGKTLSAIKYYIDKKDTRQLKTMLGGLTIPERKKQALVDMPGLCGGAEILERASAAVRNPRSKSALDELSQIWQGLAEKHLQSQAYLDLSEVQGMGYYTGIMARLFLAGAGYQIGSGGRYDNLIARFGRDLPAVGFCWDLDHLLDCRVQASGEDAR